MKSILSTLLLISSIGFFACAQPSSQVLPPKAFHEQVTTEPNVVILDVRTEGEFKGGHIEGALNCNINGGAFASQVESLDKKQSVYVYCGSGVRSAKAAKELKALGFTTVFDLDGGINAWKSAGLNVTH